MNKSIYAIFDKQTNTYQNPLHFLNHGDAIRWLTSATNPQEGQQQTVISLYPQQFVLVHTANYDDATGKFENIGDEIMQASEVKEVTKKYTIEEIYNQFLSLKNKELN